MNGHNLNKSLSRIIHNRYYDLIIADTLRYIALALISLFIPIYLLEIGYSIFTIAVFEIGLFVGSIFFHFIILSNINRIKVKRSMILSYLADILFYVLLYNSADLINLLGSYKFLLILVLVHVMASTFYWTAHHIYFFNSSNSKNGGEKLGLLKSIPVAIGVISPFLGGVLITVYGFHIAFFVSVLLLILASIGLFFSKGIHAEFKIVKSKVFDFNYDIKNWIYFIEGFDYTAATFMWPVFMFVMAVKIVSMGIIYFFANTAYSIITYIGGKFSDRHGVRKIGRIGVIGRGLSLIIRSFSKTVPGMTFALIIGGSFGSLIHIYLDYGFYMHSREHQGSAIMNRELYMHLGRMTLVFFLLFLMMFWSARISLMIAMITAGFLDIILNFIIKRDKNIID
jgi:MFS family permease